MPILIQAQNHPILDRVKWYGDDGSAQNEAVIPRNLELPKFAVKTNFLNPLAGGRTEGTENNENVEFLDDKIREKIGEFSQLIMTIMHTMHFGLHHYERGDSSEKIKEKISYRNCRESRH